MISSEIDAKVNTNSIVNSSFQSFSVNFDIGLTITVVFCVLVFSVLIFKIHQKVRRLEEDTMHIINFAHFSNSQVRDGRKQRTTTHPV